MALWDLSEEIDLSKKGKTVLLDQAHNYDWVLSCPSKASGAIKAKETNHKVWPEPRKAHFQQICNLEQQTGHTCKLAVSGSFFYY